MTGSNRNWQDGKKTAVRSKTQSLNKPSSTIQRILTMSKSLVLSLVALLVVASAAFGQHLIIRNGSSFTGTGTYNVHGNIYDTLAAATSILIPGTVNINGAAAETVGIAGNGPINFQKLQIGGSGVKTTVVNDTVANLLDVTANGPSFNIVANKLTLQDTIRNSGAGASPYNFSNVGSEVVYAKGSGNQHIFGATYGKLTPNGSSTFDLLGPVVAGAAVTHTGGALTVNQNFTVNAGYTFNALADIIALDSLKLSATGGSVTTITDTHGAVVNGSGALMVTNLTNSHGYITSAANGGAMTFANAATNSGKINGGAGLVNFQNTLATSDSLLAGTGNMQFGGVVTNSGGIAANSNDSLFFNANISNTGRVELFGTGYASMTGSFTSVGTVNLATTSTWNYNGTSQSIAGAASGVTYGNLLTTGSGTKTALGNMTVTGNFDNGGPTNLAITTDMSTFTLGITGTKENTNSTMLFGGTNNGLLFTTGTVNYNAASGTQQVAGDPALNYNLLVFSGGGTKQMAAGVRVGTASNLTINPGVIADVNAATSQLIVLGNLINGGTLNNAGTVQVGP